jgi:hypothetical protein
LAAYTIERLAETGHFEVSGWSIAMPSSTCDLRLETKYVVTFGGLCHARIASTSPTRTHLGVLCVVNLHYFPGMI